MTFFSAYNRPKAKVPPIGNGSAPVYEEVLDDGDPHLRVSGQDNLFEYVQASKDETNIYIIIERYRRGDITALAKNNGQYIDVTGMPTTLMDAYAVMNKARRNFENMPEDVRAKFDDDFNVYLQTVSTSTPEQLQSLFGTPSGTPDPTPKEGEE